MGESPPEPAWHSAARVGFRFAFLYLTLYTLSVTALGPVWEAVVPRVGPYLAGRPVPPPGDMNGSGDTTYHYVQAACVLALAAVLAVGWSGLDRRRPAYRKLNRWLRAYVRFALGLVMLGYGAAKVVPTQFPAPSLDRLVQPFGDASPMGLLWTFMGASPTYTSFTGAMEMLAGALLFFRRTTTLGAALSAGVLGHVVMLNFCYDVPVKLFSSHLLAMAVVLLLPDLGRLANLFVLNRPAPAADLKPLFTNKWLHRVGLAVRTLVVVGSAVSLLVAVGQLDPGGEKSPLHGIWEADEFALDGQPRPPLLTDPDRWRRVIFDHPQFASVQGMKENRVRYAVELDADAKTLTLTKRDDPAAKSVLRYEQPDPDRLVVTGDLGGKPVRAVLRRTDPGQFLLTSRGFHWVNEYPFNR